MKKLLTAAALVVVGLTLATAGQAAAHHTTITCTNRATATWTIVNSEADKAMTFTTSAGHSGSISAGGSTTVQHSGTSLTVYGTWSNGNKATNTGQGNCVPEPTTTTTTEAPPSTTTEPPTTTTTTPSTSTTVVSSTAPPSTAPPGSSTPSTATAPTTAPPTSTSTVATPSTAPQPPSTPPRVDVVGPPPVPPALPETGTRHVPGFLLLGAGLAVIGLVARKLARE